MSGDNTVGMKMNRAYQRLLVAILEEAPGWVINTLFAEVQGWAIPNRLTFEECQKDAEKYVLGYCGGRKVPVLKNSPFGKTILYSKKNEKTND